MTVSRTAALNSQPAPPSHIPVCIAPKLHLQKPVDVCPALSHKGKVRRAPGVRRTSGTTSACASVLLDKMSGELSNSTLFVPILGVPSHADMCCPSSMVLFLCAAWHEVGVIQALGSESLDLLVARRHMFRGSPGPSCMGMRNNQLSGLKVKGWASDEGAFASHLSDTHTEMDRLQLV